MHDLSMAIRIASQAAREVCTKGNFIFNVMILNSFLECNAW